jgi:hypothetical protein
MVELEIENAKLKIHVKGADKLWAFRSTLEIPLAHIAGVRTDPAIADGMVEGIPFSGDKFAGSDYGGNFLLSRENSFLGCASRGECNYFGFA